MSKNFITKFTDSVALVTLNNIKSDVGSLLKVFSIVSDENICIDMISQTAPLNNTVNLSFTIDDSDTAKIIANIYKFKEVFSSLTTQIISSNTKVLITSELMRTEPGIAEKVFSLLAKEGISVLLITTSETEISMLISEENSLLAKEILADID